MPKPDAIHWLERETGQAIEYTPESPAPGGRDRHLSVRLDQDTAAALGALATERGITMSQLVRDVLKDVVEMRQTAAALDAQALVDRLAADVAEVRRRLAG